MIPVRQKMKSRVNVVEVSSGRDHGGPPLDLLGQLEDLRHSAHDDCEKFSVCYSTRGAYGRQSGLIINVINLRSSAEV
jgi:hypothetical protein